MGRRGPPKTPSAVKAARGTLRVIPADEPQPPPDNIAMPAHLGEIAAAKWRELLPLLKSVRVLTRADIEALGRYCDTWEWWLATRAKLKAEGDTYPILNDGGDVKYIAQRPEVSIAHKLAQQLRQLEHEFGLTPAARASIHVEPSQPPQDDEDRRMFG